MSLEARKIFNFEEQRANDILQAIKTITPVISIIREWGKAENELTDVTTKVAELKENISALRKSLNIILKEDVKQAINNEIKDQLVELEKFSRKKETLKEKCERHESEIVDYQRYVKLFQDINTHIMELVFKVYSFEKDDEFFAMIFMFIINESRNLDARYLIQKYQSHRWSNSFLLLSNGLNYMLKQLQENKI